jgi:hypothetical protein
MTFHNNFDVNVNVLYRVIQKKSAKLQVILNLKCPVKMGPILKG